MRFVCIDFETANRFVGSVCSVGVAVFENGVLEHTKEWLVKPHKQHRYFDAFNIRVHGITEQDVEKAPEFNVVYNELHNYIYNSFVVAHNASFDMSVLRHVLDLYRIDYPTFNYLCTYKVATKVWDQLINHKLNTICNCLKIQFNHHNSQEDAIACGKVLVSAMREKGANTPWELSKMIGMRIGEMYNNGYNPCSVSNMKNIKPRILIDIAQFESNDCDNRFYNKKVVFTGQLLSMSRDDAERCVIHVGGRVGSSVTKATDYLVMGLQDYSKFADGKQSSKTKKAKELINNGKCIDIIDEDTFISLLKKRC